MGYISVSGLTIASFDTKDADRYVLMLTDKLGKINIKFKSVRTSTSKRSGYTDPFVFEKLQLYKKGKTYIATEVEMLKNFEKAKYNLSKIWVLLYIKELISLLLPYEEENVQILNLTLETLDFLDSTENEYDELTLLYFIFHLLKFIGTPIKFLLGTNNSIFFSIENDGFNLQSGFPVKKEVYSEAFLISNMNHPTPFKITQGKQILDLLNYYIVNKFELEEYQKFLESIKNVNVR